MKNFFTLLLATAMLSTAFAQYGERGQRDNDKENDVYVPNDNQGCGKHDDDYDRDNKGYGRNDNGYGRNDKGYGRGTYVFTVREKNMQIARINREYDYKIQSVKNRFGIGWHQKNRIINNLENQRDEEIFQVIRKFKSHRNKFRDYDRRNDNRW